MCMAFLHTGIGDLDELRLLLQGPDILCTTITHTCPETADILLNDFRQIALEGNPPFNAFRHQLLDIVFHILEITVAAALCHGADGTHPAVLFELPAFIDDGLAGAFFHTREYAAHHDDI